MSKAIEMPKPNQEEIERMEEVKFFLFISKLRKTARGSGLEEDELLKPLITITGCSENLIYNAAQTINSISAKPHELEIAVTAKYFGYHYDFVEKRLMYAIKYNKLLLEYINNHLENILLPKLPEDLTQEVIQFNKIMYEKITYIYAFLNCQFKFKEREQWDS